MPWLLDTNVWIDALKGANPRVNEAISATAPNEIVTCSVVRAELLHGAQKYGKSARRIAAVERTLRPHRSLAFDDLAADHFAVVRHELEERGERLGAYDLMIAAIALRWGLTLVTNDAAFDRVEGLSIENWRTA